MVLNMSPIHYGAIFTASTSVVLRDVISGVEACTEREIGELLTLVVTGRVEELSETLHWTQDKWDWKAHFASWALAFAMSYVAVVIDVLYS